MLGGCFTFVWLRPTGWSSHEATSVFKCLVLFPSVTTCTLTIRWWLPTCLCGGRRRWARRCSEPCSNTTTATESWAMRSRPWVSKETLHTVCWLFTHELVMQNYKHVNMYQSNTCFSCDNLHRMYLEYGRHMTHAASVSGLHVRSVISSNLQIMLM